MSSPPTFEASHDMSQLADWTDCNYVLRSMDFGPLFRLMAREENDRVFHGKGGSKSDFFFAYAYMFHEMFVYLSFSSFQMDVLRTLNIAPFQLHPNN